MNIKSAVKVNIRSTSATQSAGQAEMLSLLAGVGNLLRLLSRGSAPIRRNDDPLRSGSTDVG